MTTTQIPPPLCLSPEQDETIVRYLKVLDFVSERYEEHFKAKRATERKEVRQKVLVYIPTGAKPYEKNTEEFSFEAWTRNLSKGGTSLMYPGELRFKRGVICLNPDVESKRWYQFVLNWSRAVSDEFWEYGLKFEGIVES